VHQSCINRTDITLLQNTSSKIQSYGHLMYCSAAHFESKEYLQSAWVGACTRTKQAGDYWEYGRGLHVCAGIASWTSAEFCWCMVCCTCWAMTTRLGQKSLMQWQQLSNMCSLPWAGRYFFHLHNPTYCMHLFSKKNHHLLSDRQGSIQVFNIQAEADALPTSEKRDTHRACVLPAKEGPGHFEVVVMPCMIKSMKGTKHY